MGTIRRAREDDRRSIYEAHVSSVRSITSSEYTETELEVWEAGISPEMYLLDETASEFLVAETESGIGGLAKAALDEPEIEKLYVADEYQNQGIASRLVEEVERSLREHGATTVYVEASLNAVPFYNSVGYDSVGTHEKPITVDGTSIEMTMVDMEKTIE